LGQKGRLQEIKNEAFVHARNPKRKWLTFEERGNTLPVETVSVESLKISQLKTSKPKAFHVKIQTVTASHLQLLLSSTRPISSKL
jgi:hypothetical protein